MYTVYMSIYPPLHTCLYRFSYHITDKPPTYFLWWISTCSHQHVSMKKLCHMINCWTLQFRFVADIKKLLHRAHFAQKKQVDHTWFIKCLIPPLTPPEIVSALATNYWFPVLRYSYITLHFSKSNILYYKQTLEKPMAIVVSLLQTTGSSLIYQNIPHSTVYFYVVNYALFFFPRFLILIVMHYFQTFLWILIINLFHMNCY